MITSFDDIPDLFYAVNGANANVVYSTGQQVASFESITNSSTRKYAPSETDGSGVTHDPATIKCGEWPAFHCSGGPRENQVFSDENNVTPWDTPFTVVYVGEIEDEGTDRYPYHGYNTNNSANFLGLQYYTNERVRIKLTAGTAPSSHYAPINTPEVYIQTYDMGGTNAGYLYLDTQQLVEYLDRDPGEHGLRNIDLFCNAGNSVMKGKVAFFAVYARVLSETERQDVVDLCQHYLAYGEPPTGLPPAQGTSATFGPALANDDSAVYTWEVFVPQGTDWSSDLSAYDSTVRTDAQGTYLDINSATVEQSGSLFRCKATTPYNTEGITTNFQTLNVVPAA